MKKNLRLIWENLRNNYIETAKFENNGNIIIIGGEETKIVASLKIKTIFSGLSYKIPFINHKISIPPTLKRDWVVKGIPPYNKYERTIPFDGETETQMAKILADEAASIDLDIRLNQ